MEQLDDHALGIYTDGSSHQGPRRGGIGIVFVTTDADGHPITIEEEVQGVPGATNNQMELQAIIDALKIATGRNPRVDPATYRKITIFTDAQYVTDNWNRALFQWPKQRWLKSSGDPVENADLWKDLMREVKRAGQQGKRVEAKWVKGHKTSKHNKRADKLAQASAKAPTTRRPLTHPRLRRKTSAKSVESGSIGMEGQRITLRVINDEYLKVQRVNKYKVEVVSKASPYFGNVDVLYSTPDISLDRGHTYFVRLGDDPKQRRVVQCFYDVGEKKAAAESAEEKSPSNPELD